MYKFEWDEAKNKLNIEKHKLSFENVYQLFLTPIDVIIDDCCFYNEEK